MKKILLFFLFLLLSISSKAQLSNESFETWTPGQGPANWKILQNNVGTTVQWAQSDATNILTPPHTGQYAAYLNLLNVSAGIPEDYLVTPLFNAPVDGRINFYSKLTMQLDQGTIYKVKILPAGADADNISNYVELQSWTELEINPEQLDYNKITVEIPQSYENTNIRIAFVMAADNGDRWLIDDVEVVSECIAPENLSASDITQTSANLSWDTPSNATQWEIEFLDNALSPTGVGVPYSGTFPYPVSGLTPGMEYKFYVRGICADGGKSDWAGPFNFLTVKPGDNCQNPKIVTSLPYASTDNTTNYFDVYEGSPGGCGVNGSEKYLNGNDVTYAYTATQTGIISINVTGITDTYASIFVYTSCGNIGTSCFEGTTNDHTSPAPDMNIPVINVVAGTTYYIVVSSWFSQTYGYTLNIQQELCDRPTDAVATDATLNGITLGWTSASASWQFAVQPIGTGLPMGNGQTVTSNPIILNNLDSSTQYEFYVRANCGNGTFSSWAGPVVFNTLCNSFPVPYFEGFNSGSDSQFCWTVSDGNNDGTIWDLDFTYDAYEGDQSAKFDVSATTANDDMLISPAIVLTGNERLKFHYKTQEFGAGSFKVMASVTGNAPEDFTIELAPLTSYAVADFTQKTINLTNLPIGPVYFAWHVPAGYNGGYDMMIDNIIVEPMPDCAEPTDIVVSDIYEQAAHVAWTPGNDETAWEIIFGEPFDVGTPSDTATGILCPAPNYDITGLAASTDQAVFVRAVCSPTSKSQWTGPYYFTSACGPLNIPFSEGFNSDSATEECWKTVNNNGDWAVWDLYENPAYEGDEAAKLYAGNAVNDDWLISPRLILTGNERLKFHYRVGSADEGETAFKVLLSTGSSDLADFTQVIIPETVYTNENYLVKIVSLTGYTGPVYLAWQVPPTAQPGSDLFIDNVIVEPLPACPEPLYVEVNTVTQTSAQVTWQSEGSETEWELFIYAEGDAAPATGITVTALPYTITALADGTPLETGIKYEVFVKAVCSDTESSVASDKVDFLTLISNDNCDTPKTVPVNSSPECIVFAKGTLNGATESSQVNPCGDWTSADDDVWFEFTATSEKHTVSVIDITPGAPYLDWIIYTGDDCDNLTQVSDCLDAHPEYGGAMVPLPFIIGQQYKIRIFSAEVATNQTTTFTVCIKTPVTPIAVSTTEYTVEELVTDVLFGGGCAQISNISWSTGTNYPDPDNVFGDNPNGIAYFNKNDSGFPLSEGIVMTTGDVMKVPGPAYTGMEQGSGVWLGDTDIDAVMEDMLGAPPLWPSTNASVIEFDFVPSMPTLSLDFLFASEEYGDLIQCYTWDTFAVLLTDANGNTKNIALIPETETAISVFTISGAGYPDHCPGYNLDFFGKYNVFGQQDFSPTAFAGQSVVMTATADLVVNQPYHLKIAIAESDNNLDSGVFIKAGIIDGGGTVDLGADLVVATDTAICEGQTATIETNLDAATFDFVWKRNGDVIEGETNATLVVSQPGEYSVSANVTGYNCFREDSVIVEFYPSVDAATGNPTDLIVCDIDGFAEFDLTPNTATILQGLNPADYTVSYHASADDAAANTAPLTSPYTNAIQSEQAIYVRIVSNDTQCYAIKTFALRAEDLSPQFTLEGDFISCRAEDVTITVNPVNFELADATYTWKLEGNEINETGSSIQVTVFGTYDVTVVIDNCEHTETVEVSQDETAILVTIQEGCEDGIYMLQAVDEDGSFNIDTASYLWTGPGEFTTTERKFKAPEPGVYDVVVTTEDGCIGEAQSIVSGTMCDVPRGISPNGDGNNDVFDLTGLDVRKLSIFNRYGQEVYTKTNYTKEWTGQDSHGKELPTGTYFYTLEREQGESKTGWVYINRQD